MKEFYNNNKKLVISVLALVFVLLVSVSGVAASYIMSDTSKKETSTEVEPVATAEVKQESKKNKKQANDNNKKIVTEEAVEVTEEAAEIIEDSELDVVETPAPQAEATKEPEAPAPAPDTDLSNMAQNAEFPFEIHVNKQMNCITVYAMDNSGAYSIPYKAFVCSTGNATPLGTFKTPAKYIWKVLKGNVWGQYSTRITGSILFHSVPYRTNSKDALISKYYNKLGTTASAGCVRLTTIDAKWIYDNCPLGTTVIIYNDSNPGPLGKPTAMKVSNDNKWDPTDPDPSNPWIGRVLRIDGVSGKTLERGSSYDAMSGVTATGADGSDLTGNISVSTDLDLSRVGTYGVHYRVSDANGNSIGDDAAIIIVDTKAPEINGVPAVIEGWKTADVNRNSLLNLVSATDNGYNLSKDHMGVEIPSLKDGNNRIVYKAWDDYGNETTATTTVVCDLSAPKVSRSAGSSDIVDLSWQATDANIRARISVSDSSATDVSYNVTNEAWGYRFDYTVTDKFGNSTKYTDWVEYVDYEITGVSSISINEGEDPLQEISLKDSMGNKYSLPQDAVVTTNYADQSTCYVNVTYSYSTPLGTKTCTFDRTVYINP